MVRAWEAEVEVACTLHSTTLCLAVVDEAEDMTRKHLPELDTIRSVPEDHRLDEGAGLLVEAAPAEVLAVLAVTSFS